MSNISKVAKLQGVESYSVKSYNDYKAVGSLVKQMKNGKEYYLATGKHAAIVRKTENGFEYLELQSATQNGFKPLTNERLKKRFKCQKSRTLYGTKIETLNILIEAKSLSTSKEFKKLLEYINTEKTKQYKGLKGYAK
jgi:hypothetical protein